MKKKKKKRQGKNIAAIIVTLIILAIAAFVCFKLFQIKKIEIQGNEKYDAEYITQLADIEIGTHMLNLDENAVKENVHSDPYIVVEDVTYKIPDTVVITVSERTPYARVECGTSYVLTDENLNVLDENGSSAEYASYPIVRGITVDSAAAGSQIVTNDSFKIDVANNILLQLSARDLLSTITVIDLTDVNNITLQSNGGPDIYFGQGDSYDSKVKWIKKLLPSLIRDNRTYGSIDVSAGDFASYSLGDVPENTGDATDEDTAAQGDTSGDNGDSQGEGDTDFANNGEDSEGIGVE